MYKQDVTLKWHFNNELFALVRRRAVSTYKSLASTVLYYYIIVFALFTLEWCISTPPAGSRVIPTIGTLTGFFPHGKCSQIYIYFARSLLWKVWQALIHHLTEHLIQLFL